MAALRWKDLRDVADVIVVVLRRAKPCFVCDEPLDEGALARKFRGDVYCLACAGLSHLALVEEPHGRAARARVFRQRGGQLWPIGALVEGDRPGAASDEPQGVPPPSPRLYGKPRLRRPAPDIAAIANGTLVVLLDRARGCIRCLEPIPRGAMALHGWGGVTTCLACARLDDLVFLRRGDALVTRRATRYSPRCAVVARWRKRYKRYERLGILAEADAVARAKAEAEPLTRRRRRA